MAGRTVVAAPHVRIWHPTAPPDRRAAEQEVAGFQAISVESSWYRSCEIRLLLVQCPSSSGSGGWIRADTRRKGDTNERGECSAGGGATGQGALEEVGALSLGPAVGD